ncbi:hypothetical protein A3K87_20725 [Variovorax paradoxus]|uniref:O-antigen ligase-related domain-containing protein n=1 Tax=Variovorax paradoxus TaxID=34073 RepID=A0AA91DLL4_VARPD|nr:O-antigen ligase family protein [Variovorax paradoxus]OAK61364.1 hypothetical protein A3K87_20725 [Variovorax paradoxus]
MNLERTRARPSGHAVFFLVAGMAYLLLVAGGIFPFAQDDVVKALIKAALLGASMFYLLLFGVQRSVVLPVGMFLFVGLFIGFSALWRTDNLGFAVEKIDGAVLCPAIVAMLFHRASLELGEDDFRALFIAFSSVVLVLTVAYKFQFGFFERDVRFFLNGPIVYGWLMGLCGVLSFHLWRARRRIFFLVLFLCFVAALIWTESKGSIFAFAAAISFYFVFSFRRNLRFSIAVVAAAGVFYFFFLDSFVDALNDSRLSAIGRIFSGELAEADDGSVGTRLVLVDLAIQNFKDNPLFGIGLGQFSFNEYVYPHNQHVELFAELGVFVGIAHVFFVLASFYRARLVNKSIILLFAMAASSSGDASYLRFLYTFCLLSFAPLEPQAVAASLPSRIRRALRPAGSA